jgi:hypothetical protein
VGKREEQRDKLALLRRSLAADVRRRGTDNRKQ